MVLAASDELRHPHDEEFNWRESLYFNFADGPNGLGGWIYLWVVPNKPMKTGMLVSIYKGITDRLDANTVAVESPGHRYVDPNGNWVYCFKKDVEHLIDADFDDVEVCGLHMVRTKPLQSYQIKFSDDSDNSLALSAEFAMAPYDYADGAFPTPVWVATNRYHRTWRVKGTAKIAGQTYNIDTTGDSDHSWGRRDMVEFAKHTFKMWSFQTPNARNSVSVIEQGAGLYIGYVTIDDVVRSVQSIEHRASYTDKGVQQNIAVKITDVDGRVVEARMPEMFSAIGHGESGSVWGFEGVGTYQVEGWGPCTGIASYFWPPGMNPK
ncbi:MAG: hypothetical protein RIB46_17025 [Pseudomonadales bacterium]